MSAEVLFAQPARRVVASEHPSIVPPAKEWSADHFAWQQIRGLVRQVFFSHEEAPVRHVVLSAVDRDTTLEDVCRQVGDALALETTASVAVVGESFAAFDWEQYQPASGSPDGDGRTLRPSSIRLRENLWLVNCEREGRGRSTESLRSLFGEIRREFDYSVVAAPSSTESNEATVMAQLADGLILLVSAHRTRRFMARQVKEALEAAQVRILGTVLKDRVFPMPEGIYRRL